MGILIDTVMGELAVVCIVDKDDLGELYGSIFVKKQVLEPLRGLPVALVRMASYAKAIHHLGCSSASCIRLSARRADRQKVVHVREATDAPRT